MWWFLFKTLFGIETTKEKADRAQQEEKMRKRSEACQQMLDLNMRYKWMAPSDVIAELTAMHVFYEMPIYCFVGDFEIVLKAMLEHLGAHPDLTVDDALLLAQMLLWPEVKRFSGDPSCRLAILDICERFPTTDIRALLREHLVYAQEQLEHEKKGYWRDHWYGTNLLLTDTYVLTEPAGGIGTVLYAKLRNEVLRTSNLVSFAQ